MLDSIITASTFSDWQQFHHIAISKQVVKHVLFALSYCSIKVMETTSQPSYISHTSSIGVVYLNVNEKLLLEWEYK